MAYTSFHIAYGTILSHSLTDPDNNNCRFVFFEQIEGKDHYTPISDAATFPTYTSLWPFRLFDTLRTQALNYAGISQDGGKTENAPASVGKKSSSDIPKFDRDVDAEGPTSATEDDDVDGGEEGAESGEQKKPRKKGLGKAAANKRRQQSKK